MKKKDVCRTDWGTCFVTLISMLCARLGVQVGAWMGLLLLVAPLQMWATDYDTPVTNYIPTDAGLIVDLKPGDKIMMSVWIDDGDGVEEPGEEFFVCDYSGYTGGKFSYAAGNFLKLIPQTVGATKPSAASVWTVDTALTRVFKNDGDYALGGIAYTIWSNDLYTLFAEDGEGWKIQGKLNNNKDDSKLCDVAFAVPTIRANKKMFNLNVGTAGAPYITLDIGDRNRGNGSNGTKTWAFDGKTGTGFAGMTYREVFMFAIPRTNKPRTYTNAALVGFNTTNSKVKVRNVDYNPGKTIWAYGDSTKYGQVPRTLFRLYILEKEPFNTCPNSYFFAWNEQNYLKYRLGDPKVTASGVKKSMTDSVTARKIYTTDHLYCMDTIMGQGNIWKTDLIYVPKPDSTYYYVGERNRYHNSDGLGLNNAKSAFTKIRQLPIKGLNTKYAPAGACGRMVVDTTSTADNLDVRFQPAGYFLKVHTANGDLNVPMQPNADSTVWTSEQMWRITEEFAANTIKATLFSGPEFSAADPGVDIAEWSTYVEGNTIPVAEQDGVSVVGKAGWARITTTNASTNGGLEFVLADSTKCVKYDNNGHFGESLPNQYPLQGQTSVTVQAPQLLAGYNFTGWNTEADGTGTSYAIGATVDFNGIPVVDGKRVLTLYAQATYTGSINVAISFVKEDGKRYFLTHPEIGASRFASAQSFDDWTDVRQGLAKEGEDNKKYLSSYKIIGKEGACNECEPGEYVLDPHREVMRGAIDSLLFYENYQPADEVYIGLYYIAPYSILANNTWAGLFQSRKGWPTPAKPCIDSTRLFSTSYLQRDGSGVIQRYVRTVTEKDLDPDAVVLPANIKFNPVTNQFDQAGEGDSTSFMLSGVGVVDAHYVVIPDTTVEWNNEIVFGYHENTLPTKQVWSKLIGKQLLAQMTIGNKIVYFHPNHDKILTTANELRLSTDYRLTQTFTYIPDARAEVASVATENKPVMELTDDDFFCRITSGYSTPVGVNVDIVDTLRVRLRPTGTGRIKEYYGRWRTGADGLHVAADGSRYRDILIKTKTYHYGPDQEVLRLVSEQESYSLGSLKDVYEDVNFTLKLITYHELLDAEGNRIRIDTISIKDTTAILDMTTSTTFDLKSDAIFTKGTPTSNGIRLTTKAVNTTAPNRDTLVVTTTVTLGGTPIEVVDSVPLLQVSTQGTELIWSVVYNGKRYFIMGSPYRAGDKDRGKDYNNLRIQDFTYDPKTLRLQRNKSELIKGSKEFDGGDDRQHIIPWKWTDVNSNQLTLEREYGLNLFFYIKDETTPKADSTYSSALTYEIVRTHTNSNGNYEEVVYLSFGEGEKKWLAFNGTNLILTDEANRSLFYWGYMIPEYNLLNEGTYPSQSQLVFGYNDGQTLTVQTRYKAYLDYSMLLDNQLAYLCRTEEKDIADLIDADQQWKTSYKDSIIRDSRVATRSGLNSTLTTTTLTTSITPSSATSPTDVMVGSKYVNIVDTLDFRITLKSGAPTYRFKGDWSRFKSVEDAHLKIPLIRKTYHTVNYDSLRSVVVNDEYNYTFPSTLPTGDGADSTHIFELKTQRRAGSYTMDVDNNVVYSSPVVVTNVTTSGNMDLNNPARGEVRLVDEYGNTPDWCEIKTIGDSSITVKCTKNGIRIPRKAYMYIAYAIDPPEATTRYINMRLTVSQPSRFDYANNQHLVHSPGASGDPIANERQQAHENKRVLYYYNPDPAENGPGQNVELPVRERGFYGWWRWYREGKDQNGADVGDTDIPDSVWQTPPRNTGQYDFPFRIIGDSVWKDESDHSKGKKLVTMGRYTVFHYPSEKYNNKQDPPAKSPLLFPPWYKKTATYVVDISNYYDNLPLSMSALNQVDTAVLDTIKRIVEPTLSLREVFELRPWTEMAARMENYKDTIASSRRNLKYLEDHEVMAPIGNSLLLRTEQRYNYENLAKGNHSESLLGYYMRDDNWDTWSADIERQDTMIWCGGWDADCEWYTYNPETKTYTICSQTITESDDFFKVPIKTSISAGHIFDTVYYCLRARSKATTRPVSTDVTVDGAYWFNICRYMVIYHTPDRYGPLEETRGKALITNADIEQDYEILEQLNFDYNKPGSDYQVYPHPLPWADASYGYTYPLSPETPTNRYHKEKDFPGPGEYGLINRIPYSAYWRMFEQHGGAENGYMIYCDGMSSAGQVAALSLRTQLCQGQKMYFSAYVGNVSNQEKKSNPNFTFSVQGSTNGTDWHDITSYMTGDILPSNNWYQIYFPINLKEDKKEIYTYFRVRIYNMASSFDGNDFVIDDMCIFATKPPLVAYQANTTCSEGISDSLTHVVLRVDYQGFVNPESYNLHDIYYTIDQETENGDLIQFIEPLDHYLHESIIPYSGSAGSDPSNPGDFELGPDVGQAPIPEPIIDTVFGYIHMPAKDHVTADPDSVFSNLNALIEKFENTYNKEGETLFRQGYIYEDVDGVIRPVMYVVHLAKLAPNNNYKVRMVVDGYRDLMRSICAMTSDLRVSNRMVLEINGEEQPTKEVVGMCANNTYDISLRVKGSLILDSVAPIDLNGACKCDWLLYGDTSDATSVLRYGYKYSDIKKVITQILRYEPINDVNRNQHAANFASINRRELQTIQTKNSVTLSEGVNAYNLLRDLVNKGFLTLYQSNMQATVVSGDSLQYVIMPIVGTGSDVLHNANVEVCPIPILIKLKPDDSANPAPLLLGGLHRDSTQAKLPPVVLLSEEAANAEIAIRVDSIAQVLDSIYLISTDDPNFLEGIHQLMLLPDREYDFVGGTNDDYYKKGDTIRMHPANASAYHMRAGYTYTFVITMQSTTGSPVIDPENPASCRIGMVPFTVSIVPNYVRWNPQSEDATQWNNPDNWVGVNQYNQVIHSDAHFAPLASTNVIIPAMTDGMPYPILPKPESLSSQDSIKQVGFTYNTCDTIRLMPGAAMAFQQRLSSSKFIADMSMPQQKWALRSSPFKGMLSGDVFMADADINEVSSPWYVSEFDANGRNYTTGNASFWLSLYSTSTRRIGNETTSMDTVRAADAEWSKVTNGMNLPLPTGQGWAVYARTKSGKQAEIRLPKQDDVYYYYYKSGGKSDKSVNNLSLARGANAGELAFNPGDDPSQDYKLTNGVPDTTFIFGNPTLGYIDIWGFIADNNTPSAKLKEKFRYIDASGTWQPVTKATAHDTKDTIYTLERYLPPMHAIELTIVDANTELTLTLDTSRVITWHDQKKAPAPAPARLANAKAKGIMTITAINSASSRCTSRLLLGQGYHNAILDGEDAILTTVNIDHYSTTDAPATPFSIYAANGGYGLSIDLRDSVVYVPISFSVTENIVSAFDPITQLWFTGVNAIEGPLVLYDALFDTERQIIDGICLDIETPEMSHQMRYYIRRPGYVPQSQNDNPIATGFETETANNDAPRAQKIYYQGHVYILRDGHVYTIFGQQIR